MDELHSALVLLTAKYVSDDVHLRLCSYFRIEYFINTYKGRLAF